MPGGEIRPCPQNLFSEKSVITKIIKGKIMSAIAYNLSPFIPDKGRTTTNAIISADAAI